MEVKYGADLYNGYIRLEIPEDADFQAYSFKMIEKNRIKGVLPAKTRMEDGKAYLYLGAGNRRNLADIYKDKEMGLEEMTGIFQGLLPVLEEIKNYLLSEKMILWDPEYIFEEEETGDYCIVILPWQDERPNYRRMAEFFLEKTNHKDENGVNAAYHFYRQQSQGTFSMQQFMAVLEKENILKRQKKNIEVKTVISQPEEWYQRETEDIKEEVSNQESSTPGWGKYIFLVLAFLGVGVQFLNIIPNRIKVSCMAASLLFLILFFVLLIPKKENKVKKQEKKENDEDIAGEQWEVGETMFFEPENEEEKWKLQWKERGRQKQVALDDFPCKVGKIKEEVSVVINDVSVSRVHCQFVKKENKLAIMDLNSTNGTYLNGMPLENGEIIEIEKNDEILIGKVKVLVV